MPVYSGPDDAEAEHERLLGWEERMLAAIELSYRVIDVSAWRASSSARRGLPARAPTASSRPRRTAPRSSPGG